MFSKGKANIDVVDNILLLFMFSWGAVRLEDKSREHLKMAYFYKCFSISQTQAEKKAATALEFALHTDTRTHWGRHQRGPGSFDNAAPSVTHTAMEERAGHISTLSKVNLASQIQSGLQTPG